MKLRKAIIIGSCLFVVTALTLFIAQRVLLDRFIQGRLTQALQDAYPEYSLRISKLHYHLVENRLECESLELGRVDSQFVCTVTKLEVSGIERFQLLWGDGVAPDNLLSSKVSASGIAMMFPRSGYELLCGRMTVSVPDSEIVIDSLDLHPMVSDEPFFAASKFRKTRYHLLIPHSTLSGSACLGMLEGNVHCASTVRIDNPFVEVLINKDKPFVIDTLRPKMPNELISEIVKTVQLDRAIVKNGRMRYCERFVVGAMPAILTFDGMEILAERTAILSSGADTLVFHANGMLMEAGAVSMVLEIPIASPEFTFRYAGTLERMGLARLNPFLEVAEQKRFKGGTIHFAAFDIRVSSGIATGSVRASYEGLHLASIEAGSGSESGVLNSISTFITNNIALRTSNMPGKRRVFKVGRAKYARERDDEFFEFVWIALRSGIGDVVGF